MATFSALPPEIHDNIAKLCPNHELINLCCTSKWVKALYVRVLYRDVDLRPEIDGLVFMDDERRRQSLFCLTLLTHPQYGMHVRSFRPLLHLPKFVYNHEGLLSDAQMCRAMRSLTHVQTVDIGSRNDMSYCTMLPTTKLPDVLFHCATSVTLVGRMPYGLAKSILVAVNPAILKYLCLDMVQEWDGYTPHLNIPLSNMPGQKDKDGRLIAYGATSGLLKTLTGRCTQLQTVVLRRVGQTHFRMGWHLEAEDESHVEWASFIRSVQDTVEMFTFELAEEMEGAWLTDGFLNLNPTSFRMGDERFQRLILPTIIQGKWPCLKVMQLRGVKCVDGQVGTAALRSQLTALLKPATIVVDENTHYIEDEYFPDQSVVDFDEMS